MRPRLRPPAALGTHDVKATITYEAREPVKAPLEAWALLTDDAIAMKEALAMRVNAVQQIRFVAGGSGTEQIRAELVLYERSMDRAARFLDFLATPGFEERRVRVKEQEIDLLETAMRRIFARLDLTPTQWELDGVLAPEELWRLAAVPGEVVR